MDFFDTAINYLQRANVPLDKKNKNEVKHLQNTINALYKSPIVQKVKGRTIVLKVDGIWGPKTEQAAILTFGKVPTLAEMGAVQAQYSEMAKQAVESQGSGLTTLVDMAKKLVLSPVKALEQVVTVAKGGNDTKAKQIATQTEQVKQGTSPLLDYKSLERSMVEAASKAAEKAVDARMYQQQPEPYETPRPTLGNNNVLIIGAVAALTIILIVKN